MVTLSTDTLKDSLDALYSTYHLDHLSTDPLLMVHRFKCVKDREVAGLIASSIAYGKVSQIQKSLARIFGAMDNEPYDFAVSFDPVRNKDFLSGFRHRFTTGDDIRYLVYIIKEMIWQEGSIEGFFLKGLNRDERNIRGSLESFVNRALSIPYPGEDRPEGIHYLLPTPERGSACKRLNLYLRWMVRDDGLDLGIWKSVKPDKLIIPLDTHIARISGYIGLTNRHTPDWKMAEEITERLKDLDPDDPVKYDFALCRLGILEECKRSGGRSCTTCPLNGVCIIQ